MDIPEIIWRAVVQLARSEDKVIALTSHFHFHQPTTYLPLLGIRNPRCEQVVPLIPDARFTISISGGGDCVETNSEGQRLKVRRSASVLSMIKTPTGKPSTPITS